MILAAVILAVMVFCVIGVLAAMWTTEFDRHAEKCDVCRHEEPERNFEFLCEEGKRLLERQVIS